MSRAEAWYEAGYVKGAIHKLQSRGWLLQHTIEAGTTVDKSTVTWKLVGTGEATEREPGGGDVPTMNAARTAVTATFKDYEANDWIDSLDVNKQSENEQQIVQQTAAMAIGRKFDRLILGTMDTAAASITTIGDGSAALGLLDVFEAQSQIAGIGAGSYEYFCALRPRDLTQLELSTRMSSEDYVGPEYALMREVGARKYRGINFVPMPDDFFAVPSANQIDLYIWAKQTIGFEWNKKMVSRIDYIGAKKKWLAANDIACASTVLLPEGIRRLRVKSNAALVIPAA